MGGLIKMEIKCKLPESITEIWQEAFDWAFAKYADAWMKLARLDAASNGTSGISDIAPEVPDDTD